MKKVYKWLIVCLLFSLVTKAQDNGPIKIPFTLKSSGYLTMVIEDADGKRVRNLFSDTWFDAGKHFINWDGSDDLGRDLDLANKGIYKTPFHAVSPGTYTLKILSHQEIKTTYEFSVYSSGNPPWTTNDHTGGWLANHTPPQAAMFVPAKHNSIGQDLVFLGSYISEGPDGFAWVDLNGKKLGGMKWLGGVWTGAPFMSYDPGKGRLADVDVYIASSWETAKKSSDGELRINSYPQSKKFPGIKYPLGGFISGETKTTAIGGLASFDGTLVVSLPFRNKLIYFDFKTGSYLGSIDIKSPKGIYCTEPGALFVLSGKTVVKFPSIVSSLKNNKYTVVNSNDLDDPVAITVDDSGNMYVSDAGNTHQVIVLGPTGKYIRSIGKKGKPKSGKYDPMHMNNPAGITIDSRNQLWVAENDFLPKRVSVWNVKGELIKAFYGPVKYGGGGTLDYRDSTKFYYAENNKGVMEFSLDWRKKKYTLENVLAREEENSLELPNRTAYPETPIYYNGKTYFINCYNSNPTSGSKVGMLFVQDGVILKAAAAVGRAKDWALFTSTSYKAKVPAQSNSKKTEVLFVWSDKNKDGRPQPDEVEFKESTGTIGGVTILSDLSFCVTRIDGNAVQFKPVSNSKTEVPTYAIDKFLVLAKGVAPPGSTGGDQVLVGQKGDIVITQGIEPFHQYSISGLKNGKPTWSYPNLWPGLHASHHGPIPFFPGEIVGTTRLLGRSVTLNDKNKTDVWAINSNHGMIYLFTMDGLFITTLFKPIRVGENWNIEQENKLDLKKITLGEENFWPSITQLQNGNVYMVDGARGSILRIDGLSSVSYLPGINISVSKEELARGKNYQDSIQIAGAKANADTLIVPIKSQKLVIDGKLDDWDKVSWVRINLPKNTEPQVSNEKSYAMATTAVYKDRLFFALKSVSPQILKNSGETPLALFKTGGAIDIMLGTLPKANPQRILPDVGDIRILLALVKNKIEVLIYRQIDNNTKKQIPFSSPQRTVLFDNIENITSLVDIISNDDGTIEFSIPINLTKLKPRDGMVIKGDLGVLQGDGFETTARSYWHNKSSALISDLPSEAELTPNKWGFLKFKKEPL
ncbi:hypothetical protein [Spirosoma migulaei]